MGGVATTSGGVYLTLVSTTPLSGTTDEWNLNWIYSPPAAGAAAGTVDNAAYGSLSIVNGRKVTCSPFAIINPTNPKILNVAFGVGTACNVLINEEVALTLPFLVRTSNPTRSSTVTLSAGTLVWDPTVAAGVSPWTLDTASSIFAVPYTVSVPQLQVTSLRFESAYPSSTTVGTQLTSLQIAFTPGITLRSISGSPATLTLFADRLIFAATPSSPPAVVIGNCIASTAVARTDATNEIRAALAFTLLPVECVLSANEPVIFTIPQQYLAVVPAKDATVTPAAQAVWMRLATSAEPEPQYVQFPFSTGTQRITQLVSAVPSTTVTDVAPSSLNVTLTLFTAPANTDGSRRVFIRARKGTFKPFQTNIAVGVTPSAKCSGASGETAMLDSATATTIPDLDISDILRVTLNPDCYGANGAALAGATLSLVIPASALLANPPAGTPVAFSVWTEVDPAPVTIVGYTTTAVCGSGTTLSSATWPVDGLANMPVDQRAALAGAIVQIAPTSTGFLQCTATSPNVWFFKVQYSADARTVNSPGLSMYVTNWGFMWTTPILATVIVYPPTTATLQTLQLSPQVGNVPLCFAGRIDRMLSSGAVANAINPVEFQILGLSQIMKDIYVFAAANAPGTLLRGEVGQWAQATDGTVMVSSIAGPVFLGYCQPPAEPASTSDDAWFGLLALIALPLLCLCLLGALAYYFLSKRAPAVPLQGYPMMMPGPVMEVYPQSYPAPYPPPYW